MPRKGGAAERLNRRSGSVSWEIEDVRDASELLLPEGQLGIEYVALEPIALPGGLVGILDIERRER